MTSAEALAFALVAPAFALVLRASWRFPNAAPRTESHRVARVSARKRSPNLCKNDIVVFLERS